MRGSSLRARARVDVWDALTEEARENMLDEIHNKIQPELVRENVLPDDEFTGVYRARYAQLRERFWGELIEARLGYQVNQREARLRSGEREAAQGPSRVSDWLKKAPERLTRAASKPAASSEPSTSAPTFTDSPLPTTTSQGVTQTKATTGKDLSSVEWWEAGRE